MPTSQSDIGIFSTDFLFPGCVKLTVEIIHQRICVCGIWIHVCEVRGGCQVPCATPTPALCLIPLSQSLSLNLSLGWQPESPQQSPVSYPIAVELQACVHMGVGSETGSSCLHNKHSYALNNLSTPHLTLLVSGDYSEGRGPWDVAIGTEMMGACASEITSPQRELTEPSLLYIWNCLLQLIVYNSRVTVATNAYQSVTGIQEII